VPNGGGASMGSYSTGTIATLDGIIDVPRSDITEGLDEAEGALGIVSAALELASQIVEGLERFDGVEGTPAMTTSHGKGGLHGAEGVATSKPATSYASRSSRWKTPM